MCLFLNATGICEQFGYDIIHQEQKKEKLFVLVYSISMRPNGSNLT